MIEERNFNQWLSGTVTHQGQRRGRLRDFLPCSAIRFRRSTRNSIQVYTGYLRHYQASWAAYPDARPALEVARSNGWRVGVLTNRSTKQQNAKLAAIGLADLVDVVCTSGLSASASRTRRPIYRPAARSASVG